jgi:hypothetical protein
VAPGFLNKPANAAERRRCGGRPERTILLNIIAVTITGAEESTQTKQIKNRAIKLTEELGIEDYGSSLFHMGMVTNLWPESIAILHFRGKKPHHPNVIYQPFMHTINFDTFIKVS